MNVERIMRVPAMSAARTWRWCLASTMRDVRRAARRGRAMPRPAAERLFLRRWHRVARALDRLDVRQAGRLGRERVRGWF